MSEDLYEPDRDAISRIYDIEKTEDDIGNPQYHICSQLWRKLFINFLLCIKHSDVRKYRAFCGYLRMILFCHNKINCDNIMWLAKFNKHLFKLKEIKEIAGEDIDYYIGRSGNLQCIGDRKINYVDLVYGAYVGTKIEIIKKYFPYLRNPKAVVKNGLAQNKNPILRVITDECYSNLKK